MSEEENGGGETCVKGITEREAVIAEMEMCRYSTHPGHTRLTPRVMTTKSKGLMVNIEGGSGLTKKQIFHLFFKLGGR